MYDIANAAERARRRRRAGPRPLSVLPEKELVDDLPEEFVALAEDLRALVDAGLIRAQVDPNATVRFGPAPEGPAAA